MVNRTERLLDLIAYLLNAREPVSWQEIKNHFPEDYAKGVEESNQRKFERDKAELIALGIPIDYHSGTGLKREGYIIEKEKLFLPEIKFTPQEASLLMVAAGAVLDHGTFPYGDQLESALAKIIRLDDSVKPPPQDLTISYSKPGGERSRSMWVRAIQDALDRRKTVEIRYHAFSTNEVTQRTVNPYGLVFRRGSWTMIAWDHLREDIRNFVLSRVLDLQVNSRRPGTPDYEIPPDFSLEEYRNQQPWEIEIHEPVDVKIQVSKHRLPELSPQLLGAERVGEDTFRVRVTNRTGFIRWVLSQKTDILVLSPPGLRDDMRAILQVLL